MVKVVATGRTLYEADKQAGLLRFLYLRLGTRRRFARYGEPLLRRSLAQRWAGATSLLDQSTTEAHPDTM